MLRTAARRSRTASTRRLCRRMGRPGLLGDDGGTFGAFGAGTWELVNRACDARVHALANCDDDPWRRPAPKRDFMPSAIQRGNVRMLWDRDWRRRSNHQNFASNDRGIL